MDLQEDIFKGATRPVMLFGVPMMAFISVAGITILICMWAGNLVSWWIAPPVLGGAICLYGWMRLLTNKDDQRLRQFWLRTLLSIRQRNRGFWKARAYSPAQLRGIRVTYRR